MRDTLDRLETHKATIQVVIQPGATHVGAIVGIVLDAVRDITRELGDWARGAFEVREAARRPLRARGSAPMALCASAWRL